MADVGIKITAQDTTRGAFSSVDQSLTTLQTAARSMAGALSTIGTGISLGAFVTMTKQIVDGLDAMNDLKDASGASIENISALEDIARRAGTSFDTVSTSLIKLNQGLSNSKPGSDTEAALKAIGLTVKELKALDPAEAFLKIATSLSGFADDANKARLTQELFGKSLKEVAPLLKDVADRGTLTATVTTAQAEAAEKLNKQMFSLQKNALDMGRAFTSSVIPALAEGVERFILAHKHAGSLLGVLSMYARLDYGKNVQGNLGEIEEQIARLEERATRITSTGAMTGNNKMIADLKAQAAFLKELRINKILEETYDTTDAVSRKYLSPKKSVGDLPIKADKPKAAPKDTTNAYASEQDAAKEWAKAMEAANAIKDEAAAKSLGLSKAEETYQKYLNSTANAINEKTIPAANAMVRADFEAAIAQDKLEKGNRAATESRTKYVESLGKGLASMQEENQKLREYNDSLGLSKEAIAELNAVKLESQATTLELMAIKEMDKNLDQEQYDLYKKKAEVLRETAGLLRTGATKEAGIETAKQVAAEWQRGWQSTDQIAREVFADWAVNGASAAKTIGDTLKKALLSAIYEATLKPLVFQVYTSLTGGAGSVGGTAAQLASGGSSLGSVSGLSGLFGAGGAVAEGITGVGAAMINGPLSGMFGEMGASLIANSTAIAGALPYVGAALAAVKMLTDYKITPAGGAIIANLTGGSTTAVANRSDFDQTSSGILSGGNTRNSSWADADPATTKYINAQATAMHDAASTYAAAIGLSSASLDAYTAQIAVNTTGMDAAAAQAAINAELVRYTNDSIAASYGTTLSAVAKDGETSSATLARLATSLSTVNDWAGLFGTTLQDISITGAAAASTLIEAFGGLDKFNASLGTYYQNYFTEAEQRARTIADVRTSLSTAGIDLSIAQLEGATKEGIRAWVDVAKALYDAGIYTASQLATVINAANRMAPIVGQAPTQGQVDAAYEQARHDWAVAHPWEDAAGDFLNKDGTVTKGGLWAGSGGGGGGLGASIGGAGTDDSWKNSIKSWFDKMNSTDSGIDSINRARDVAFASYKTQLSLAQGGDATARQNITGFADTFIDSIKNSSKTLLEEQLGIARVKEQVGGLLGEKKPEVLITDAIIKSGDGVVTAIRRLGDMLGDPGNPGGSGSGSQPIAVPIANAPPRAPANASGDRAAAAQIAAMAEALAKMERRLESIDVNTREGAKSARNTYTVLDEATNGARSLQTVAG